MSWERARGGVAVASLRLAALAPLGCAETSASPPAGPPVLALGAGAASEKAAAGVSSGAGAAKPRAPAAEKKLRSVLYRFGINAFGTSTG